MLVLLRKPKEAIVIDGGIKVTVLKVTPTQVHLGIEAPEETLILREELVK